MTAPHLPHHAKQDLCKIFLRPAPGTFQDLLAFSHVFQLLTGENTGMCTLFDSPHYSRWIHAEKELPSRQEQSLQGSSPHIACASLPQETLLEKLL